MRTGTLIWLSIFAVSAATFFIVAAIVTINGLGDLRALLRPPVKRDDDIDRQQGRGGS